MKNFKFLKLLALFVVLITSINTAWAGNATFSCVPQLTFSSWSSGNECKVIFDAYNGWSTATFSMSGTGLMYKSGGNLYEIYSVTVGLPGDGAQNLHFERWSNNSKQETKGQYDAWCFDDNNGSKGTRWTDLLHAGSWITFTNETFDISSNVTIYFDNSDLALTNPRLYFFKRNWDSDDAANNFTRVAGTPYWYKTYSTAWEGYAGLVFKNAANWDKKTANIYQNISTNTCFTPASSSSGCAVSTTAPVGPKNIAISNTTTTYGGDGSVGDPYIVKAGTAITCSASADKIENTNSVTLYYKFSRGSTNYSTTKTNTVEATPTANTDYNVTATIKTMKSSNSSREFTTSTIYYTAKSLYTELSASKTPAAGSGTNPTIAANWVEQTNGVSVTAGTEATGYDFTGWTSSNGTFADASSKTTTFTPSADNAVAVANYAKHDYTILYSPSPAVNFTYTTAQATAQYGDVVNLTITPEENYTISSVTAVDGSSKTVTVSNPSDNNYSFTMPASNVTVTIATAKTSTTVTLDVDEAHHGNIASATTSQEYAYGAATTTIPNLPLGTDGYKFMGFYTLSAGGGTKVINADGSWIASVDGYTDGSKNWIRGSDVTLYAYYQAATITSLALPEGSLYTVGGSAFTATATVSAFDGNALVCWAVLNSSEEEVSTTFTPASGNSVTVSIPATPGSYKVVASLKAGTTCSGDVLYTAQQSFDVQGNYTVSITNGTGSSFVSEFTTATATANAAAAGMKFDRWSITGSYTLTSGTLSSRTISFTATSHVTVTATYVDRTYKKVYFAKPSGWTVGLMVYAWDGNNTPTYKNADWPGVEVTTTETVSGTTYYYYKFYTDNNGEGDNQTSTTNWTKLVFSHKNNSGTKTADLTLADGHYYHVDDGKAADDRGGKETATVAGSTSPADWYVTGYFNGSNDWGYAHPIIISSNTGSTTVGSLTTSTTQYVKIYRASTNQWFKWTGGASDVYYDDKAAEIGTEMVMREYNHGSNYFTSTLDEYRFSLDVTSTTNPKLTISPAADEDYTASSGLYDETPDGCSVTPITQLHQYTPTSVTATAAPGYRFKQWHYTGCALAAGSTATSNPASFTATANGGQIKAEFTNEGIIYFDNTMSQWKGDIYVYMLKEASWWDNKDKDGQGPGLVLRNSNGYDRYDAYGVMTRIGSSNIYYYDYQSAGVTPTGYVAFTKGDFHTSAGVYKTSAAYRADFNSCFPMYLASQTWSTTNETGYHNSGYWKRYNVKNSGFTLKGSWDTDKDGSSWEDPDDSFEFTADHRESNTFSTTVELGDNTYEFKIYRCAGAALGNNGTMQPNNSSGWEMTEGTNNCKIYIPASGTYTFTLNIGSDHIYLSVEYPLLADDYRLLHVGAIEKGGANDHKHPSQSIRHITSASTVRKDTICMFIDATNASTKGTLYLQKCDDPAANSGKGSWSNVTSGETPVTVSLSGITETGYYNFELTQTTDNAATPNRTVTITPIGKYEGDFYIRTDGADGGWEMYRYLEDNKLHYTSLAPAYNYYHCHWLPAGKNVRFTVANDYSPAVSDTLFGDATYLNSTDNEYLPTAANVRFAWKDSTNVLSRAFINGSSESDYLNLFAGNAKLWDDPSSEEVGHKIDNVKFEDIGDWTYQYDLYADRGATVAVRAQYNSKYQFFIGTGNTSTGVRSTYEELYDGDESLGRQNLRVIYNFRTNQLITGWMPSSETSYTSLYVKADAMVVRHHQNAGKTINFASNDAGNYLKFNDLYGVLELARDSFIYKTGNDEGGTVGGKRALASWANFYRLGQYWISFPFDVRVGDIFGIEGFGTAWRITRYRGDLRASKGFFGGDGTTTFWENMTPNDTLKAYHGYTLLLNSDYFDETTDAAWKNKAEGSKIAFYFPAIIEGANAYIRPKETIDVYYDDYTCPHDRPYTSALSGAEVNHKETDTGWRVIGVPAFISQTNTAISVDAGPKYLYNWNSNTNDYDVITNSSFEFKSSHAYMVQYNELTNGKVKLTWHGSTVTASAPQRVPGENYQIELQLLQSGKKVDQTYVELREEAERDFQLNEDLYKIANSKSNIFSFAGTYDVAANVLPEESQTVTLGVKAHANGSYTFHMPSSFSGTAILFDNVTNTRKNLTLEDYTVDLESGKYTDRFFLELNIQKTTTVLEGTEAIENGVFKYLQNDHLYIRRNGDTFNATGVKVK